jgi:hypothetical protein
MSPKFYAFINAEMTVVQLIVGALNDSQLAQFERDYRIIFGAEFCVPVYDEKPIYLGGSYDPDSGVFSPPPSPEPEVVIEEIIPE